MREMSTMARVGGMVLFFFLLGAWLFVMPARSGALDPDLYEDDDAYSRASVMLLNQVEQYHTFHDAGDEDWVKFYGLNENWYYIKTKKVGERCNTIMELYYEDGSKIEDDVFTRTYWTGDGEPENIQWQCLLEGIYYLRVKQADPSVFGEATNYALCIWDGEAFRGKLKGKVTKEGTREPVKNASIVIGTKAEGETTAFSDKDGSYSLKVAGGTYVLRVCASGFEEYTGEVEIPDLGVKVEKISLRSVAQEPADLLARGVSGPATAVRGEWVDVMSSVANKGRGSAGAFEIGIFLTSDVTIRFGEDCRLESRAVSGLASGKTSKGKTRLMIPDDIPPGTYWLGVLADPGETVYESSRENNASVSRATINIQ